MQRVVGARVHSRSMANGLQSLENGNGISGVTHCAGFSSMRVSGLSPKGKGQNASGLVFFKRGVYHRTAPLSVLPLHACRSPLVLLVDQRRSTPVPKFAFDLFDARQARLQFGGQGCDQLIFSDADRFVRVAQCVFSHHPVLCLAQQ